MQITGGLQRVIRRSRGTRTSETGSTKGGAAGAAVVAAADVAAGPEVLEF